MMRRTSAIWLAGWLAGVSALALAQELPDPTRPPPQALTLPAGDAAAAPVHSGPQLQSVLVGTRGREVAVIDGQVVRLGEKFNGAVLVQVDKNKAVLRRGAEVQVLTLVPEDEANGKSTGVTQR